ncbi:uncharacterized protein LOC131689334 [Topomyia yanbarensis]|uniref:uncharacterized protein LOC131689334 n=1 Tax=Topomyia yanbarensis TaxID=2498891 RepID=UPI00273B4D8A|nr:uncharacterized protein LOC131689334 [Topomyia yanbarensis]
MHRKRYFPADLEPHPLHYAALRGYLDRVRELIAAGHNVYEPIQDGETAAHVAIAEGQPEVAKLLLEEYRKDFEIVGEQLVRSKPSDQAKFWLRKTILIAVNEDQRNIVQQVCQSLTSVETMKETMLILIKVPNGNKELTVVPSNSKDQMQLFKLAKKLLPNGILSWNSTGPEGKCETLLQLAAYHGKAEILELLAKLGADLSFAGSGKRRPLHSACEASQNDIIEILINKYGDQFDPTALDENCEHALHYILSRKNKTNFELLLNAMVDHRKRHFGDSASKAFNFIFKAENKEYPYIGIWSQLDTTFWGELLERQLERFHYDLSYKWKHVTALLDMIPYRKARKYYLAQIQNNPQLLKVSNEYGCTALHALISSNELQVVKGLYADHKDIPELFECDAAIQTLTAVMVNGHVEMTKFILERHTAFFHQIAEDICEKVVMEYIASNYDVMFDILQQYLPEVEPFLKERRSWIKNLSDAVTTEYNETYDNLLADFSTTLETLQKVGKTLNSFSGGCFLNQAIRENQFELVEQLLNAGVDFDYIDTDERHAIHWVNSVKMLRLLVAKHPDGSSLVHRKDRIGMTLLHVTCPGKTNEREELILELLRLGAKIDERTYDQATVLFCTYDEELFCFLTDQIKSKGFPCIDTELRDFEGKTALHMHLRHLNSHISSIMLRAASSWVNFTNKGDSYLAYLIRFEPGLFDAVFRPILEANPDKTEQMFREELKASRARCSELFVDACLNVNSYCIDKFLDMDLDFDIRDYRGFVGLLCLLESQEIPESGFVKRLLEKGIDVNIRDADGRNALMILGQNYAKAKKNGYTIETVKALIDRNAKVDEVDRNGETVLHYAFKSLEMDWIEVLLEGGANFRLVNGDGKLPYEMAPGGFSEIFSFLC